MSQHTPGSRNIQIAVTASQNVNIRVNGQTAVELRTPAFPRPLHTETLREIDLLKAIHALTEFTGRETLLQEFVEWCRHPRPLSLRTLIGRGGAGKTRFAYELYRECRQWPEWSAHFVRFLADEAKEINLWEEVKSPNTLLIIDYASEVAKPLADLMRPLIEPGPSNRRLRVLLLARTADWDQGWLASLRSGRTETRTCCFIHKSPKKCLRSIFPTGVCCSLA